MAQLFCNYKCKLYVKTTTMIKIQHDDDNDLKSPASFPLYRSHLEMKQTLLKQIICILLCLYAVPSSLELTHLMKPVTLLQRLNLNWKQNQLVLETEILPLSSIFYLHCVSQVSCKISRKQVEKFETQFCFVLFICNNVSAP